MGNEERSFLLDRSSLKLSLQSLYYLPFGGDSVGLGISAERREEFTGNQSVKDVGGGGVFETAFRLGGMRVYTNSLLEHRQYSSALAVQDNSGYSGRGFVVGGGRPLTLTLDTRLEQRPLYTIREGGGELVLLSGPASGRLKLTSSKQGYETVAGDEQKRGIWGALDGVLQRWGFLLRPAGTATKEVYTLNTLRSATAGTGALTFSTKRRLLGTGLEVGLTRGYGMTDYDNYEGDELSRSALLYFRGVREPGGSTVELTGSVGLDGFYYPQGVRADERDVSSRELALTTRVPVGDALVGFGIENRVNELWFIEGSRSGDSRIQEKYGAHAKTSFRTPVTIESRVEIAAVYTVYPFDEPANLLVRYLEATVLAKARGMDGLLRLRLQDQGLFAGGVYQLSTEFRELWLIPRLEIFSVGKTRFFARGNLYFRQDLRTVWETSVTEVGVGLGARGWGVDGYVMLFKRTDETPYLKVSALYSL